MPVTTSTFTTSGTFTVPGGVTSLAVELRGAKGIGGAAGGFVSGTAPVDPGSTITISVNVGGGSGVNGGRPGGGYAGILLSDFSYIWAVAGGGGGRAAGSSGLQDGGAGGGTTADDGQSDPGGNAMGGGGGTNTTAGAGGSGNGDQDGDSAVTYTGGAGASQGGGGGGGGYYGGGGGGYYYGEAGAGGGGASYTGGLTGSIVNTKGGNTSIDDGNVFIDWSAPSVLTTSTTNLTMSCLSTVFSTYGGAARGYSLQSYSSIVFSDDTSGPTAPPIHMSSFLGKAAKLGYSLLYSPTLSVNMGNVPIGSGSLSVAYLDVYAYSQIFEVLYDGAPQSPAVYLTTADSSSRTLSLSGSGVYSVYTTSPNNTTVQIDLNSEITYGITYTTIATVGGTMTASPGGTFPYSYTVSISATGGAPE